MREKSNRDVLDSTRSMKGEADHNSADGMDANAIVADTDPPTMPLPSSSSPQKATKETDNSNVNFDVNVNVNVNVNAKQNANTSTSVPDATSKGQQEGMIKDRPSCSDDSSSSSSIGSSTSNPTVKVGGQGPIAKSAVYDDNNISLSDGQPQPQWIAGTNSGGTLTANPGSKTPPTQSLGSSTSNPAPAMNYLTNSNLNINNLNMNMNAGLSSIGALNSAPLLFNNSSSSYAHGHGHEYPNVNLRDALLQNTQSHRQDLSTNTATRLSSFIGAAGTNTNTNTNNMTMNLNHSQQQLDNNDTSNANANVMFQNLCQHYQQQLSNSRSNELDQLLLLQQRQIQQQQQQQQQQQHSIMDSRKRNYNHNQVNDFLTFNESSKRHRVDQDPSQDSHSSDLLQSFHGNPHGMNINNINDNMDNSNSYNNNNNDNINSASTTAPLLDYSTRQRLLNQFKDKAQMEQVLLAHHHHIQQQQQQHNSNYQRSAANALLDPSYLSKSDSMNMDVNNMHSMGNIHMGMHSDSRSHPLNISQAQQEAANKQRENDLRSLLPSMAHIGSSPHRSHHHHNPDNDDYHELAVPKQHFNLRPYMPLGTDTDEIWLSRFLTFLRSECVEVFIATSMDVFERKTSKKIQVNQVGLRCRFCAHLPYRARVVRSSCFPSSVSRIYQSLTMMIREHFSRCQELPNETRERYTELKWMTKKGEIESKSHWIESAKAIGMVDTEKGIFQNKPIQLTVPTDPASASASIHPSSSSSKH